MAKGGWEVESEPLKFKVLCEKKKTAAAGDEESRREIWIVWVNRGGQRLCEKMQ